MKRLIAAAAVFALALPVSALAETVLSAQGGAAGGSTHVPLVAFGKSASDAGVAEIQVTDGNTLTKSLLAIATNKVDMGIVPVAAGSLLSKGKGPYKKLDEAKRKALKSKLRAIFGFDAGYYTYVTYADSGIEKWEDIKGKQVLIGPPSGSASAKSIAFIKAATGYEPGEDYVAVKMGWGAVQQQFTDRKVDVIVRPGPWPNALLTQLQASGEIRILGMPKAVMESKVANEGGLGGKQVATSSIGEGNYTFGHADGDKINMVTYKMMMIVNEDMDEELVYNMTKAFFDRYDEAMKSAAWMPGLGIKKVVTGLDDAGVKLHPGAVKYYKEAGIELSDSVM